MSSSNQKDFTSQGHADKGHWNDPPAQLFAKSKASSSQENPETSSTLAAGTADLSNCVERLKWILDRLAPTGAADYQRKLNDASMRLKQLESIDPTSLSPDAFEALVSAITSLENKDLDAATKYHTQLMLSNYESNSKWLIGLKRLIDLKKESNNV
ncbi:hypothetical protein DSO57_1026026 [Entomophthora muscae]|uniref:Uncharacterized protein n=1 Tax=Entomophthora muscae TaxID=34485 RepID=A0ACC2TPN0_9FUNG|nr:hypothetical protein DSO57_1026026 [Entomophthora muscae]